MATFWEYLLHFGINLFVIVLVVSLYYLSRKPNRNKVIVLIMAGVLVYVVIDQMVRAEIGFGIGFGMFAIFSLLRFRTVPVSLRDMTYLFTAVALSLVNALLLHFEDLESLLAVNISLLATLAILEWRRLLPGRGFAWEQKQESGEPMELVYDNLLLIKQQEREALLDDLRARTGLQPERVEITGINFEIGTANLRVWFAIEKKPQLKEDMALSVD